MAHARRQAVRHDRALVRRRQREHRNGRPAEGRRRAGGEPAFAFIDIAANPDANELARQAADEKAAAFKCGKDEATVVGKPGRGTEIAKP